MGNEKGMRTLQEQNAALKKPVYILDQRFYQHLSGKEEVVEEQEKKTIVATEKEKFRRSSFNEMIKSYA